MFGMGIPELIVIAAIGALLFGPALIRGGSRKIGSALRDGRKAITEIKSAMHE